MSRFLQKILFILIPTKLKKIALGLPLELGRFSKTLKLRDNTVTTFALLKLSLSILILEKRFIEQQGFLDEHMIFS